MDMRKIEFIQSIASHAWDDSTKVRQLIAWKAVHMGIREDHVAETLGVSVHDLQQMIAAWHRKKDPDKTKAIRYVNHSIAQSAWFK